MQPPRAYLLMIRTIDGITYWSACLFAVLLVPLVLANVVEVFMRYALNRPTMWALETTVMTFGAFFMLGAAYTLLKGAHVRTDVLWERFSERRKGIIDAIGYLVFFLPSMVILFFISYDAFIRAWNMGEVSTYGAWRPLLWPLRGVVPLTAILLFLQGISEFLKSVWAAWTGEVLAHREKIEI